jgi:hypothetical protein
LIHHLKGIADTFQSIYLTWHGTVVEAGAEVLNMDPIKSHQAVSPGHERTRDMIATLNSGSPMCFWCFHKLANAS